MSGRDPTSIESLLKLAGERDQPSPEAMERARAAARISWKRGLQNLPAEPVASRPRPHRRAFLFAGSLAASLVALACAAWWWNDVPTPAVSVARVATLQGEVRVDANTPLTPSTILYSGQEIRTQAGRVAFALGDALSLRVDRQSRLRFEGPGHITVLAGAVYVDSGGLNAQTALRIDTPAGEVRHEGTQYQVQVHGQTTRVLVREGRVSLSRAGGAALALGAGDRAQVTAGLLDVERGRSGSGTDWEWAAAVAPGFDMENRPLSEFLAWLAREHGWPLRYADAATQTRALEIRLHGSMRGLDGHGMLERASLITGVALVVRDGALLVGP